jgi:hypothetical protein
LIDLWPAVIPLAAWSTANLLVDDHWHVAYASSMVAMKQPLWPIRNSIAMVTAIVLACVFPLGAIAARRRTLLTWLAIAAPLGLATAIAAPMAWSDLPAATTAVTGLIVAVGTASLIGAARQAGTGDRDDRFLAAWIVIQFAFVLTTWNVAVRYLVSVLPPLALLVTRAMIRPDGMFPVPRPVLAGLTIVTLAVGVAVVRADTFWVGQYRHTAEWAGALARQRGQQAFFKAGAWGFEYYALRAGLRYFGRDDSDRPGDLIVGIHEAPTEPFTATEVERLEYLAEFRSGVPPLWLHTMNAGVGAGFYASLFGPLPIMFSNQPAARIVVWRVRPDAITGRSPVR